MSTDQCRKLQCWTHRSQPSQLTWIQALTYQQRLTRQYMQEVKRLSDGWGFLLLDTERRDLRIRILAQWLLITALELQDQDTVRIFEGMAEPPPPPPPPPPPAGNLAQAAATATQHASGIPDGMLGNPNALGNAPWWPSASVTPLEARTEHRYWRRRTMAELRELVPDENGEAGVPNPSLCSVREHRCAL